MDDDDVKVGQTVRLYYSGAVGIVREIDHVYEAARVELLLGGEPWCRLDELEVVEPPETRTRVPYIGEQHEQKA
jgi:hypothetical protein